MGKEKTLLFFEKFNTETKRKNQDKENSRKTCAITLCALTAYTKQELICQRLLIPIDFGLSENQTLRTFYPHVLHAMYVNHKKAIPN